MPQLKIWDDNGSEWKYVSQGAKGDPPDGQIILTAAGGWPSTTNGCADPVKIELATNKINLYVMDFDKDADEHAEWTVVMPSDWDGGTVTAVFYWTCTGGGGSETVEWNLQGRSFANDEALDQAWGTEQPIVDTWIADNDLHVSGATPAITLAGTPAASELVQFRAYRDVSGDDLGADARLIAVRITFTRS